MRRWLPVIAAMAAGCADSGAGRANVAGKKAHKLMVDGLERDTLVYVPEKAQGNTPAPVVFMFHGTSGDGEKFFDISRWREKADAEGLIAVFPSALTYCLKEDENGDGDWNDAGETKVTTKWAGGELGDPVKMPLCSSAEVAQLTPERRTLVSHPLADDLKFVDAMLELLSTGYTVDVKRIYASGFSNGAQFAGRLAVERSDRFAAIAMASGGLAVPAVPGARPISVLASFGEVEDGLQGLLGITRLPLEESVLRTHPLIREKLVGPLLTTLRLEDRYTYSERTINGRKTSNFDFTTSTSGAANTLRFTLVQGQAHEYPNGTNHPIVLADVLWELFKSHRLP